MREFDSRWTRRRFLRTAGLTTLGLLASRAAASELVRTPAQTAGPFYPDHLPLDRDNDLVSVADANATASREITLLSGRVLDAGGTPIAGATVEIWQVDSHGVYLHSGIRDGCVFAGHGLDERRAGRALRCRARAHAAGIGRPRSGRRPQRPCPR